MKRRNPSPGLMRQVDQLWDTRMALDGTYQLDLNAHSRLAEAGQQAAELYALVEMPQHGPRQPRAVLEKMAATALRSAM